MYCENCKMKIHEGEILWVKVKNYEYPVCPVHNESLKEPT